MDRHDFLKTLAETCVKTGFQVHAYCLMRNHFHLVVETPNANLVEGMRWLLSTYTIRLNHRHRLCGHVFSGRYKAMVVEGDLPQKAKGDPNKLVIAARLRKETTRQIAQRLHLGSWKSLRNKLYLRKKAEAKEGR